MNEITKYQPVIDDIKAIIEDGRNTAYKAVSSSAVMTYWTIGRRIIEDEQDGEDRAEYGKSLSMPFLQNLQKSMVPDTRRETCATSDSSICCFQIKRFGTHVCQI